MEKEPSVCIIILNYNGYEDTVECINSINKINYKNYKVIIVDNNSKDNSIEMLENTSPEKCVILQTQKNLGYAGGNNIGIKYALNNKAEYICILNNDVVVDQFFLNNLIDYLLNKKNVAMVGPLVLEYYEENIIQSTGAKVNLYKGQVIPLNQGMNKEEIKEKVINCDYISGACLLFKSSIIDEIGFIPENYFLFYEETEWCLKAKSKGYEIICNCNAEVKHKGSASVNRTKGLSEYYMLRNRVVFQKRNVKNVYQLLYFYLFLVLQTIYRIIFKKEKSYVIKYYLDGLFGTTDRKYKLE